MRRGPLPLEACIEMVDGDFDGFLGRTAFDRSQVGHAGGNETAE